MGLTTRSVNEEQLSSSCTVRVLRSPRPDSGPNDDASSIWIARVLEVRAHSPQHVYLRVFWIYKPADLPDGKQAYHGDHEMIVSDNMTVIDASAVVGSVEVRKWDEESADTPPEGLWWRQRLEMSTRKLSVRIHASFRPFQYESTNLIKATKTALHLPPTFQPLFHSPPPLPALLPPPSQILHHRGQAGSARRSSSI